MKRQLLILIWMPFLCWATAQAQNPGNLHAVDTLPLQPVMEFITGDLPILPESYLDSKIQEWEGNAQLHSEKQGLASAFVAKGNLEKAEKVYLELLETEGSEVNADARLGLSDVYRLQRSYGQAMQILEPLLPDSATVEPTRLQKEAQYLYYFHEYLNERDQRTITTNPVAPETDRAFGIWLGEKLSWPFDFEGKEQELAYGIRSLMSAMRRSEPKPSMATLEGIADLLLVLPNQPEARYMGSFAFERAAALAPDTVSRDLWREKSLYSLEAREEDGKYYNRRRFYEMERVINRHFEEASERVQTFQASLPNDGSYDEANYPWSPMRSGNIIDFWPNRDPYEVMTFVNAELQNEESRIGVDPNANPLNKKVDPKKVKSNVGYNLYAILVFAILFSAIGVILWRFFKAQKEKDARDGIG